jgi:exportin-1
MTQTKVRHLKDTMCDQFSEVFQLCQFVLDGSRHAPLVEATLETLLRFLHWIPLGYIFETALTETLVLKFLGVPLFRFALRADRRPLVRARVTSFAGTRR